MACGGSCGCGGTCGGAKASGPADSGTPNAAAQANGNAPNEGAAGSAGGSAAGASKGAAQHGKSAAGGGQLGPAGFVGVNAATPSFSSSRGDHGGTRLSGTPAPTAALARAVADRAGLAGFAAGLPVGAPRQAGGGEPGGGPFGPPPGGGGGGGGGRNVPAGDIGPFVVVAPPVPLGAPGTALTPGASSSAAIVPWTDSGGGAASKRPLPLFVLVEPSDTRVLGVAPRPGVLRDLLSPPYARTFAFGGPDARPGAGIGSRKFPTLDPTGATNDVTPPPPIKASARMAAGYDTDHPNSGFPGWDGGLSTDMRLACRAVLAPRGAVRQPK